VSDAPAAEPSRPPSPLKRLSALHHEIEDVILPAVEAAVAELVAVLASLSDEIDGRRS